MSWFLLRSYPLRKYVFGRVAGLFVVDHYLYVWMLTEGSYIWTNYRRESGELPSLAAAMEAARESIRSDYP